MTPEPFTFADDGTFPNSPLPALLYRRAFDPAADAERLLAARGWTHGWRDGIYPFTHYHSTSHEALAIIAGTATVQLGGPTLGRPIDVAAGDLLVIPAGVAHQNRGGSADLAVVGAYPDGRAWDLLRGHPGERPSADRNVAAVPLPTTDPLGGPLLDWSRQP